MNDKPIYPLRVLDLEDGTEEIFDNETELASTVEWCNTDDPEENMKVIDNLGREVRLKIKTLQVITCELKS